MQSPTLTENNFEKDYAIKKKKSNFKNQKFCLIFSFGLAQTVLAMGGKFYHSVSFLASSIHLVKQA